MMSPSPSPTGSNGREPTGRFAAGNNIATGNPHAKRIGLLRSALLEAVTVEDMTQVVEKLLEQAKAGDIQAAREVLLRTLGRPTEADLLERLERLEELFERKAEAEVA